MINQHCGLEGEINHKGIVSETTLYVSTSEKDTTGFMFLSWDTDQACSISNRVCQSGLLCRIGLISFITKSQAESLSCVSIVDATWKARVGEDAHASTIWDVLI